MEAAQQGPLTAELHQLDSMFQAKSRYGGGFEIFALGLLYGAQIAVNVMVRADPAKIALMVNELRVFQRDYMLQNDSGRRMDVGPDVEGASAVRLGDGQCSPPTFSAAIGGDDGTTRRGEDGEAPAQGVRSGANAIDATQAADILRGAAAARLEQNGNRAVNAPV